MFVHALCNCPTAAASCVDQRMMLCDTCRSEQFMHRIEVFITRGAEGRGGKVFVGDMTEDKSIELASKLVSEGFVFSVSGLGALVCEPPQQGRPSTCGSTSLSDALLSTRGCHLIPPPMRAPATPPRPYPPHTSPLNGRTQPQSHQPPHSHG